MRTLTVTIATLLAIGCGPRPAQPPPRDAMIAGNGVRVHLVADPAFSLEIFNAENERVLEATRISATEDLPEFMEQLLVGWDGYIPHEGEWIAPGQGKLVETRGDAATAEFPSSIGTFFLTASITADDRASISVQVQSEVANKIAMHFVLRDNEHFFGLGERYVSVDHRGLGLYSWAEEGGLGAGEAAGRQFDQPQPNGPSMTYFPVPLVHSTEGYSLLATTTFRTEMHMGDESTAEWRVAANANTLPFDVYVRETPAQRLEDYTRDTGRPPIPAPWVWGPRRHFSRNSRVDGVPEYQVMRARNLPITGVDDALHFLPHHSYLGIENNIRDWTDAAHAWGLKVTCYNTPYVSATDPSAAADYAYGVANDLFEKNPDGSPATTFFISGRPQDISEIDLTTPAGFDWFKSLLQRSIDLGYDGWMHDFGEYTQRTSHFSDGRTGEEVHNHFPVLSARAAREILDEQKPNDYIFFVRSGYTGTHALVPSMWGGDAEASFDDSQGLPSAVRGGINLGLVAVPYYGSDVTGYKCVTNDPHDKEMFIRWVEFGAVSPMMVEQDSCANPFNPSSKWELWNDDETQDVWRQMAGLHTRLAPYFRTLAIEANRSGMPLMRHPFLTHPDERDGWFVDDSFFLGPSLYAAPVVRRGERTKRVWLPPGRYVEWNLKSVHSGPAYIDVDAPLTQLPLFLVDNSMVPLLDSRVMTLAPATEPSVVTEAQFADVLDVVVALAPGGTAGMTLSDGTVITATRGSSGGTTLTQVDESALRDCESCFVPAEMVGQISRLRFNGPQSTGAASTAFEDVTANTTSTRTLRVRWDVWRSP